MKRLNQAGSHVIAVAVALLVLGVIAFAGYTVMNKDSNKTSTSSAAQAGNSSAIQNDADLTAAGHELDNSSGQLDSSLNDSALDSDLNDLL